MKKHALSSLLILIAATAAGQKPPIKFGDVPIEQLQMTVYDKDSSAAAVVLSDYGESRIDYNADDGFIIKFDRIRRVKILTKDGYEWGNFVIPLYHQGSKEEDLGSLKAVTYNLENGKVVETKMKNEAVFKEERDQNWTHVKLALPNVKEGSVVEITYRVTSPYTFNFQDWDFQSTIPTMWSEYRTRIPEYFSYRSFVQGYLAMAINESKTENKAYTVHFREKSGIAKTKAVDERIEYIENINRLVIQNAPAFKSEPYMTTYRDYISRINFELSTFQPPGQPVQIFNESWEKISAELLKNESFGGVVTGSNFLKEHAVAASAGKTDPKEIIGSIYSYVKGLIKWDGQYRVYSDGNLRRVIENKKGSSAEINLLLVSMLQKAGITANPVVVSTRDHGFIRKEIPVFSQFNYVIASAEVEGKIILMDATDRSLPIHILPERCLNGEGLIISPTKSGWVKIDPVKSRSSVTLDLVLADDGTLKGKAQFTHDGYFAQSARKSYFGKSPEEHLKTVLEEYHWEIESSSFENLEKLSEPMKEVYQVRMNEHIQAAGNTMYINPIFINRLERNPFQSETRAYPVDYGSPEEQIYMVKITIPEGWVVDEIPAPKYFVMPANGARYIYSATQTGNVLSLTSHRVINKALFSFDEYKPLRDFYTQIVAKQAEQIVLKKK
ncbi:MAG: transglutaminase domain-containing protein [Cytophagales bacterium]|nr:transglutaminase domain-containing protein [Cytophagales bacterium]